MPSSRDLGLTCGSLPPGRNNDIGDIAGVRVGHCTLRDGAINTGVTAILPHGGNVFREKVVAASHVINGFGKSVGLIQVDELGTLETPILLTNTLSVGTCTTALVRHALAANPDIGRTTSTVNPLVLECNDGPLNDIQAMAVTEEHAMQAIADAAEAPLPEGAVLQGGVGAGTGMTCSATRAALAARLACFRSKQPPSTLECWCFPTSARRGTSCCPAGAGFRHRPPLPSLRKKDPSSSLLRPTRPWSIASYSVSSSEAASVLPALGPFGAMAAAISPWASRRRRRSLMMRNDCLYRLRIFAKTTSISSSGPQRKPRRKRS